MRKKLFLLIPALLGVFCLWLGLSGAAARYSFDQIFKGYAIEPPAAGVHSCTVVREGTYPGLSDVPISYEQARPYRELMAALRGQTYLRLPSLLKPSDGGTAIYYLDGCMPSCMAYWDGRLWLYDGAREQWNGFLPLPPGSLGEAIHTICNE